MYPVFTDVGQHGRRGCQALDGFLRIGGCLAVGVCTAWGEHVQASLLNTFRIGDWTVEPMHSRIAGLRGTHHVEPRAMDVLLALAQRAGDTVGRDELIAAVWKHTQATDESLSRCISLLRHALSDDQDEPRYIETVRKRGYRLIPPIETMQRARSDTVVSIAVLPFVNLSGDPHDE